MTNTSIGFPNDKYAPLPIPGTPYHVKGEFRIAWEQLGGRESFGLPLGDAFQRPNERRVTQHFERAVLEQDLDTERPANYEQLSDVERVHLWLTPRALGTALIGKSERTELVAERFGALYNKIDGTWRLGRPISPERNETLNGSQTTVQYFERGRLEWNEQTGAAAVSDLGIAARAAECAAAR